MATWHDRLRQLKAEFEKREGRRISNRELGELAGVSSDNVKKYLQGEVAQPRGETLRKLAEALGSTLEFLRDGIAPAIIDIPRLGHVGAGELLYPIDDEDKDDTVAFALGISDPVAVGVKGNSMAPVYRAGDVIICERMRLTDPDRFLGKDCVVQLASGAGYIKKVMKGTRPNRFNLISYSADPIEDVTLNWAAPVKWVRRS